VNLPQFAIPLHQQSRGIGLLRDFAWNHLKIASQERHCGWRTEKSASRVSMAASGIQPSTEIADDRQ